jgi:hypothetical protein
MIGYYDWKMEYYTQNNGFPIPTFTAEIGKDKNGWNWFVRVKYRMDSAMYEISFDYSEDGETPFLKDEVCDAENYCIAYARVYHARTIEYDQFNDVVRSFKSEHMIK